MWSTNNVGIINFFLLSNIGSRGIKTKLWQKSPPVLSNVDEIDCGLHDLQMCESVTDIDKKQQGPDIDKKQQGPVIYLWLPDKVRSACRDIAVAYFNKADALFSA